MTTSEKRSWADAHERATLVDLHAHPPLKAVLFPRGFARYSKGSPAVRRPWLSSNFYPLSFRTAFPMLQQGGVDVMLSTAYVPEVSIFKDIWLARRLLLLKPGLRRKLFGWTYFDTTRYMLDRIEKEVRKYNRWAEKRPAKRRRVEIVSSVDRLNQIVKQGKDGPIALIHSVEGGHSLHGKASGKGHEITSLAPNSAVETEVLENLQALFDEGVASLTVAHFYPNHIAAPCFPYPEFVVTSSLLGGKKVLESHDLSLGLTPIGEKVIERMLDLGMLVDVTHSTPAARRRIYDIAKSAGKGHLVVATHVGVYEINPSPYNLEDWEIEWIANEGGVVGAIFMNYWLMAHETKLGLNFISRTIEHICKVGGVEVAAIGTDFDGFTDPPDDLEDAAQLPRLTTRLMSEYMNVGQVKYTDDDLAKILGGNALRVLRSGWGKRVPSHHP